MNTQPGRTIPLRGWRTHAAMLDDYSFSSTETRRFNMSGVSIPMHRRRGRWQCKVVVGIPLVQKGMGWRMSYSNVGDTTSYNGQSIANRNGFDHRRFASREAALKYCRKLWPSARVDLVSYGLQVIFYQPDSHAFKAVNIRGSRARAKLLNFSSLYGSQSDHVDAMVGALHALGLNRLIHEAAQGTGFPAHLVADTEVSSMRDTIVRDTIAFMRRHGFKT